MALRWIFWIPKTIGQQSVTVTLTGGFAYSIAASSRSHLSAKALATTESTRVYHLCHGGTLAAVPTTRPRYQVTETPEVARALDRAAKRWPGEPRSKLLVRLVEAGADLLENDEHAESLAHRAAVLASAGRYAEAFGTDYLTDLRADWPA